MLCPPETGTKALFFKALVWITPGRLAALTRILSRMTALSSTERWVLDVVRGWTSSRCREISEVWWVRRRALLPDILRVGSDSKRGKLPPRRHPKVRMNYAPVLPESPLPPGFDLGNSLHSLDGSRYQLPVVPDGNVSSLLELERGVLRDSSELYKSRVHVVSERLSPCVNMYACVGERRTMVMSFPAAFRNALVHLTFRGFRFILKVGSADQSLFHCGSDELLFT